MPDITIAGPDGTFGGYLAEPADKSGAGILIIQEIFGVNADVRAHCDRFAAAGYFALAPDIFWRQEPGIQLNALTEEEWARAFDLYQGFNVESGIEDLKAGVAHLRDLDGCSGKVGTVGFCLGGLLAYLMATRSDTDCNISYYGVGIDERLGEAGNITAPTILHVAEEDGFVPKDKQAVVAEGLAGIAGVEVHSYPGVDHAFARNGGDHYDADAAALADGRTEALLRSALG